MDVWYAVHHRAGTYKQILDSWILASRELTPCVRLQLQLSILAVLFWRLIPPRVRVIDYIPFYRKDTTWTVESSSRNFYLYGIMKSTKLRPRRSLDELINQRRIANHERRSFTASSVTKRSLDLVQGISSWSAEHRVLGFNWIHSQLMEKAMFWVLRRSCFHGRTVETRLFFSCVCVPDVTRTILAAPILFWFPPPKAWRLQLARAIIRARTLVLGLHVAVGFAYESILCNFGRRDRYPKGQVTAKIICAASPTCCMPVTHTVAFLFCKSNLIWIWNW